jgi:hypothetical protein
MFRAIQWALLAGLSLFLAQSASAQCLPALCALSISLQSDASGIALGGSGSSAASMSFGTMSAYSGTVPTGVTRTVGATNWTISSPFDIVVTCTNLLNLLPCTLLITPTYTLTAQLQSADSINTWKIGSSTLTSTSATTLTASGTYGAATQYTMGLTIPFTEASGLISNTINFLAVSN